MGPVGLVGLVGLVVRVGLKVLHGLDLLVDLGPLACLSGLEVPVHPGCAPSFLVASHVTKD